LGDSPSSNFSVYKIDSQIQKFDLKLKKSDVLIHNKPTQDLVLAIT
jgi:hypothetical protein